MMVDIVWMKVIKLIFLFICLKKIWIIYFCSIKYIIFLCKYFLRYLFIVNVFVWLCFKYVVIIVILFLWNMVNDNNFCIYKNIDIKNEKFMIFRRFFLLLK